ncbi:RNA 3'-terminal phosphate cyclase/enolpyruvate transferase [Powellomyces hirtus]|nr:RNA 3'-terminal phosphate cyclase/enolpyruvate transferase [Powellomyces hirtus]
MVATSMPFLRLTGHKDLRYRLILAVLTRTSLEISGIRSDDTEQLIGLNDAERSFLDMFAMLVTGASIEVLTGGTRILVRWNGSERVGVPGGQYSHRCPSDRSIGWFAECVLILGVVARGPLSVEFTGPASDNSPQTVSVDALQGVYVPLLKRFGAHASVTVVERAALLSREGGRVVVATSPPSDFHPAAIVDASPITSVRGVAYSVGLSPDLITHAADAAAVLLRRYIEDTDINIIACDSSSSPVDAGYGLTLVASGPSHTLLSASCTFCPRVYPGDEEPISLESYEHPPPENLGVRAARQLLQQISRRGCIDTSARSFVLTLLALASTYATESSSATAQGSIRLGALDADAVGYLRDLKAFASVEFDVENDTKSRTVILTPPTASA